MDRAELIARARAGFELVGRGVVVTLLDDVELRYAPVDEMKERLVEIAEPTLLFNVILACGRYDPRHEAVLLFEHEDGMTVTIVRPRRSEAIGGVDFTTVQ